ncbi:UDP-4-amino-4,6-dideoxy-N-acetyl-beta-L-altrosamine transaminase [Planomicrobium sp. MB-3u-38]|uniref:UDP-4-amino-4, 6-dideoxy-N-acetyl-beta-L-altrosamine transaminase n=1 Tax=Planomicrobium sp. MB-3u-38 TaxID=2058318 RepID=UPI000C7C43B1|nr:UDP-4-amino-4,6-dideoxy-N-acetyl-beta-L-altrosamine transaminase [Planomicrobium sp. MB-3u-38]PKH10360.1 UDP-4-amino-4,6-dideoxy-N-acetyl-beta-L-altrosamine transaminase [Planomicrobium sp. MB-3u-38]
MVKEKEYIATRTNYLPYGKQWVDDEDIETVISILKGDYLTTGPAIQNFEQSIAEYTGSKYAVSFSSGTAALHGACHVAGIGGGDEVITTPMTFAASANCILYQGATPVFADIDEKTYNIDIDKIAEKITENTKAIIPVHFTGQPVDLDELHALAAEHNLIVIEDAAHALGATYKGKPVGGLSAMTMFSFHPVKHITTGEGGVITTNNEEYYKKLIQFRSHGITREKELLQDDDHGPWYYEMQFLGFNYRMTDIQAALGISQLKKSAFFLKQREDIAEKYNQAFSDLPEIKIPFQATMRQSSWHLYIIRLDLLKLTASRKIVFEDLQKQNIGVNVHYIPVHTLPYYQELGYKRGSLPIAEELYEEVISLPIFPKMTEKDVEDVVAAVRNTIIRYTR